MATAKAISAGGKIGQGVNAFNTALRHSEVLARTIVKLQNSGLPITNSIKNWVGSSVAGSPEVREFENAREKYSMELVRAWRGIGGNESDIQGAKDAMRTADTFQSLISVLADNNELLEGKIQETETQVSGDMGEPVTLLSKAANGAMEKIYGLAGRKMPQGEGRTLDEETAGIFLIAAGRNKAKARQLATENGWKIPGVQ